MPELPEVETMCRGILSIVGCKIRRVVLPKCSFRPIRIEPSVRKIDACLRRQTIEQVSRLGKRVVIHAGDWALVLQPKMTGLVSMDQPPDWGHVRLRIELVGQRKQHVLFWDRRGLGTVQLVEHDKLCSQIADGRLGPDALAISNEDFECRFSATKRPVKVALLDQRLVAGIGNLYASEMLHAARIHPEKYTHRISAKKYDQLFMEMRRILLTAIQYEGSTLSDGAYRNALNDPGSYQNEHRVYDRAGEICPVCKKSKIKRIVQAQRSTFFCPKCQRL